MRFAFFDDFGRVELSVNDDTVTELPKGAVELNEQQWAERFDLKLLNGELLVEPLNG